MTLIPSFRGILFSSILCDKIETIIKINEELLIHINQHFERVEKMVYSGTSLLKHKKNKHEPEKPHKKNV